ncbi:hypothetical protein JRQ81_003691 [Phrynocephalus forsythii]|uniref:[histone H3]-lysine(9) N-trimethyltransferase n=1 Tax=Phrynocephalus forsythii TaxID=171643 RepID=A0A9Q0XKC4_9SAUR|nr:hypothetical protein JRQ81_003691 [Phrynocephalus forsythii]
MGELLGAAEDVLAPPLLLLSVAWDENFPAASLAGGKVKKKIIKLKMAENLKACHVCCKSSWSQLQDLCRLEKVCCSPLGITRKNLFDFEVEYLCDYMKVQDEEYYFVKWRGYPESENTWEPRKTFGASAS